MPTISDLVVRVRADTTGVVGSLGALGLGLAGLGVGAGAAATAMVKMGMDAQNQLAIVQGLAGVSANQMQDYTNKLEKMSLTYGSTMAESAKGLYYVVSANFQGADALNVLRYAMEAAKASGSSLSDTSHALAGTLNAYGASARDAGKYSDMMTAAVTYGMQTYAQFSGVIGAGAATAAAFHVPFDQLAAAEASITTKGLPATMAMTGLQFAITKVMVPADAMGEAVKKAGGHLDEATFASDSFVQRLNLLYSGSGLTLTGFEKLIGGTRSSKAALDLVNDGGAAYVATLKKIDNAHGLTDAAFKVHDATLVGGMEDVGAAVSVLSLKFVNMITPTVQPMLQHLAQALLNLPSLFNNIGAAVGPAFGLLKSVAEWIVGNEIAFDVFKGVLIAIAGAFLAIKTAQAVSALLAFAATIPGLITGLLAMNITIWGTTAASDVAQPSLWGTAAAATGLNIALGPLILIVAAIALAIGALILVITHWTQITQFLGAVWKDVQTTLSNVWKYISDTATKIWGDMAAFFLRIGLGISGTVTGIWNGILSFLQNTWNNIRNTASTVWTAVSTVVGNTVHNIWATIQGQADNIFNAVMGPFTRARDAIGGVFKGFMNNLIGIIDSGLSGIENFVNLLRNAVNFVAGALGAGKPFPNTFHIGMVPKLAAGTSNWPGGIAMVGEAGTELVQTPNTKDFLAKGPVILNLPPGSQVHSATETAAALPGLGGIWSWGQGSGANSDLLGSVLGDAAAWVTGGVSGIVHKILDAIGLGGTMAGDLAQYGGSFLKEVGGWLGAFIQKLWSNFIGSDGLGGQGQIAPIPSGSRVIPGAGVMTEFHGFNGDCTQTAELMAMHVLRGWPLSAQVLNAMVRRTQSMWGADPSGAMTNGMLINDLTRGLGMDATQYGGGSWSELAAQYAGIKPVIFQVGNAGVLPGDERGVRGHAFTLLGRAAGGYLFGDPDNVAARSGQLSFYTLAQLAASSPFAITLVSGVNHNMRQPVVPFAEGGWINEPIQGIGASGTRYSFGERGPEYVSPAGKGKTVHFENHFHGTNLTPEDVVREQLWMSMIHGS